MNWLYENVTVKDEPKPEVGMGCTMLGWSDRYAYTITRISKSGKTFWAKRDLSVRVDCNGMSEDQSYDYTSNPLAPERMVRLCKRDQWRSKCERFIIGYRNEYYDYSF